MVDNLSKSERSALMSRVRQRNTAPEEAVRACLRGLRLRFQANRRNMPGSPDILLPDHMTAIFVHGCFWHRHAQCKKTTTPKTRRAFWTKKFRANVTRDRVASRKLRLYGWRVVTIWECQTKDVAALARILERSLFARKD
jgi:DNA mismatch endonuclease (patch repair protein)